jgi:gliding motility-associated-like protein
MVVSEVCAVGFSSVLKRFLPLLMLTVCSMQSISAQCPWVYDIAISGGADSSICVPDIIQMSAKVDYIPAGAEVRWYSGATPGFNPLAGQGTQLASTTLLPLNFPLACPTVCPDLQLLYSGPCTTSGAPFKNEYVVISSGGGFYASDLRLELDAKANPDNEQVNNSIELGANPCQIKIPDAALINQLRTGTCNPSNLIPAGPGDYIPPGSFVVFFLHSDIGDNIEFSDYCASGKPIYILQNACERTLPAFSYNSTCTGNDRFVYQSISLKGCPSCFDELNYDLCGYPMFQSTYVVDNNRPLSSNSNGGVQSLTDCRKPPIAAFYQPDTTLQLEVFLDDINDPLCGTTLYYKAVVLPNEPGCPNVTTSAFPLKVECPFFSVGNFTDTVCSGTPLSIALSGPPNAVYSWLVDAPISITGLSSNQLQTTQILQTPVSSAPSPVTVVFEVGIVSGECVSEKEKVSIVVLPLLQAEISGALQVCEGQSTTLSVEAGGAAVLWSTGSSASSISVSSSGDYSVIVSNNKCSARDTVTVEVVEQIIPVISGDTLLCPGGTATLTGPEGYDAYLWSTGEVDRSIVVNAASVYTLEVKLGDCSGAGTIEVKEVGLVEVEADITAPGCNGANNGSIILQTTAPDNLIFWQDGQTGKQLDNLAPGAYVYTITLNSVCKITDTVVVPLSAEILPVLEVLGVGCNVGELGSIKVVTVQNATEPILYALNGAAFSPTNIFETLGAGTYSLQIRDAAGCEADTLIEIISGTPLTVTLPDTLYLSVGESLVLDPSITGAQGQTTYRWSPSEGLSCADCLQPSVSATQSRAYQLYAESEAGCRDSALVYILLQPPQAVYVPQAFSPNGDGLNDRLQVLSSSAGVEILSFQVFNRWGTLVFETKGSSYGGIRASWDGTFSGKPAPVDTYIYVVEVKFPGEDLRKIKGAVLLIR